MREAACSVAKEEANKKKGVRVSCEDYRFNYMLLLRWTTLVEFSKGGYNFKTFFQDSGVEWFVAAQNPADWKSQEKDFIKVSAADGFEFTQT